MEIFFLDVGQGTCQVIMPGQRKAIVIDCGLQNDKLVLQFLQRTGVEYLERLIVSHSHDDHIGGAVSIMGAYQGRVGKYCFVQDHMFLRSACRDNGNRGDCGTIGGPSASGRPSATNCDRVPALPRDSSRQLSGGLSVTALACVHALRGVGLRNCRWNSPREWEAFRHLKLTVTLFLLRLR